MNISFLKELIINKEYESGRLMDEQKNQIFESIEDIQPQLFRHFIMKCLKSFLKMPNNHMIILLKEKIRKIKEAQEEVR